MSKPEEYTPYKYHPKFCKKDGKELLSARRIVRTEYSEKTGQPIEIVKYLRYCPDWQQAENEHTVVFGQDAIETPDGVPIKIGYF